MGDPEPKPTRGPERVRHSRAEWRERLTPDQFAVTRRGATERPFSGEHLHRDSPGAYRCVCCGARLFRSEDKFDSGCGWPSFTRPARDPAVETVPDHSFGMVRTEARCQRCDAHLGHVFDDGPRETGGQRWCINSLSLDFEPAPGGGDDR